MTKALGMNGNTCVYNYTGHPALSINAGFHKGLPVGMMIIGQHFKDDVVLKMAYGFEQAQNSVDK